LGHTKVHEEQAIAPKGLAGRAGPLCIELQSIRPTAAAKLIGTVAREDVPADLFPNLFRR
jgi:hypothetical protein